MSLGIGIIRQQWDSLGALVAVMGASLVTGALLGSQGRPGQGDEGAVSRLLTRVVSLAFGSFCAFFGYAFAMVALSERRPPRLGVVLRPVGLLVLGLVIIGSALHDGAPASRHRPLKW